MILLRLKSFHVQQNVGANIFVRVVANMKDRVQMLDTVQLGVARNHRRALRGGSGGHKQSPEKAHLVGLVVR